MKIAIATYRSVSAIAETANQEDVLLIELLGKAGLDPVMEIWNDPAVNWQAYEVVIIKSTWDYHDKIETFKSWLLQLQQWNIPVLNPVDTLLWNCDKHYLGQVQQDGLPVIPSVFLEPGTKAGLQPLFTYFNTQQLIVKPCVSAGSKNTFYINQHNARDFEGPVNGLLQQEPLIVQPFVQEIKEEGEWSFLFFNGLFSHAIIKRPKAGDFRVQSQFGGTIQTVEPLPSFSDAAAAYVKAYAQGCLYARVDGVIQNNRFLLMELELIEPYLFLFVNPQAGQRYCKALTELIPPMKFRPSF